MKLPQRLFPLWVETISVQMVALLTAVVGVINFFRRERQPVVGHSGVVAG